MPIKTSIFSPLLKAGKKSLATCCLGLVGALLLTDTVHANDPITLTQVYYELKNNYIEDIIIEDFAINTLKNLKTLDKNIQIANDTKRISLYHNAKIIRSWTKPEDKNDIKAWGKLSAQIIKHAIKTSPELDSQSFRLIDDLLKQSVTNLGHNSKYYPALELEDEADTSKRFFTERFLNNVLYLKIGDFNQYTKNKVKSAIADNSNLEALIIDLRGNNGGNLVEMVNVVDLFLDDGVVISTRDRNKDITYYSATQNDIISGKPIVVLVDGITASAAEALAASMQEQGRAKVIGTTTFGKGTVQSLVHLDNDSVLALTTAEFFTPADQKINGVGVSPDICVTEDCLPESRSSLESDITTALKTLKKN